MMGLLHILLTEIPRDSLARQHEQTATRAAASLYQETVRFGDAGPRFRKLGVMEPAGSNPSAIDMLWNDDVHSCLNSGHSLGQNLGPLCAITEVFVPLSRASQSMEPTALRVSGAPARAKTFQRLLA